MSDKSVLELKNGPNAYFEMTHRNHTWEPMQGTLTVHKHISEPKMSIIYHPESPQWLLHPFFKWEKYMTLRMFNLC